MSDYITTSEAMQILQCTRSYLGLLRTGLKRKQKDGTVKTYEPKLIKDQDWIWDDGKIIYKKDSILRMKK